MKTLKLSKKTWLFIGLVIFVIVLASLGRVVSQKLEEQEKLDKQLTLSQSRLQGMQLEQLTAQRGQLEEQLKQVSPQFESVKAILSKPVSSTTAATVLFEVAKTNRLVVTEMTSSSLTNESLEGAKLLAVSLTAKVEGKVSNLVSFITELNRSFTTGVVKSATITVPEGASSDNATASIQLVVYTYRGN